MRNLFFVHILLMVGYTAASQAICGFDGVHQKKMQLDPAYRKAVEETELSVQRYISKNKSRLSARTTGTNAAVFLIPVVVHVMNTGGAIGTIYNPSDAQIQNAIDYLNQVYNGTYPGTQGIGDLQLQFVLAAKDPLCNSTSGIDRVNAAVVPGYSADGVSSNYGTTPGVQDLTVKNLSRWNPFQYYNIWVVNKIDSKDGTSGTFIAGYAYFPGSSPLDDGMIMLATQMVAGQKTLPHEMGHAFGLYHTFEGSIDKNNCPANGNCFTDGDHVCDTDPETYNQLGGVFDFSCRTGTNPCTGSAYSVNTESNYMNYTNCYNLFTSGQKSRILAYAASAFRKSLTTSSASNSINSLAYSYPVAASCTPTTSSNGLQGGYAGILNIELNNRDLGSSLTFYDNGYVDGTNSCLNVLQLTKGNTYTFTATVAGIYPEQLRGWIDFNNDGQFDNTTEQIVFTSSISTSSPSVSGNFTVPSTATLNTVLRLRVIDDISTLYSMPPISDACTNPVYGQAEDYPVYITANSLLPVTLNSFTGELKNRTALLSWNTSREQTLESFNIEKSIDGTNFLKLATIEPKNNSSSTNDYTYTDANLSPDNYYRLQINETNGPGKLSHIVFLHNGDPNQKLWLVNNPIGSSIQFGCTRAGATAKLQLYNSIGAVIAEKTMTTPAGQIDWELKNRLAPGTYIVRAFAWGETFTYKVIKQQ